MKIVYQQRKSLKSTAILFIVNKDNFNNMMYYKQFLDKQYSGVDFTCLINGTQEVDKLFNLVVKVDNNNLFDNLKYFIKNTTHSKILLILDNLVTLDKGKYKLSFPSELPKKDLYFPFYNKQIVNTNITQRKSILNNYDVFTNNFCFLSIGKKESKARLKINEKLKDINRFQELILLKKKLFTFEKIQHNNVTAVIDEDYKVLKRKKISVESSLVNIIDEQSLPIDKYGLKLSRTKTYSLINERIDKYIEKHKFSSDCPCSKDKSIKDCPCRRGIADCGCRRKITDCPCSKDKSIKDCPCKRGIADCGHRRQLDESETDETDYSSSEESYCSCENEIIKRPVIFPNKNAKVKSKMRL